MAHRRLSGVRSGLVVFIPISSKGRGIETRGLFVFRHSIPSPKEQA